MSLETRTDEMDRHGEHEVLARGLLPEAVDCLGAASLLVGDDDIRAPLNRCADELNQVATG